MKLLEQACMVLDKHELLVCQVKLLEQACAPLLFLFAHLCVPAVLVPIGMLAGIYYNSLAHFSLQFHRCDNLCSSPTYQQGCDAELLPVPAGHSTHEERRDLKHQRGLAQCGGRHLWAGSHVYHICAVDSPDPSHTAHPAAVLPVVCHRKQEVHSRAAVS